MSKILRTSTKFNETRARNTFSTLSDLGLASTQRSHQLSTITMSLDEQFKSVAEKVRNWKTKPSDTDNLALYSLYKQATIGDVNIAQPSDLVGSAKWKAWNGRKGISQDDAKKQYIDMAESLHSKFA